MNRLHLPKIISFKVSNSFYSLFAPQEELCLSLNNSLNILIGKNSIGKTTTIELILYSLIGDCNIDINFSNSKNSFKIDISNNKFKNRSKNDKVTTEIIFKISDTKVEIHRDIIKGCITKLYINNNLIKEKNLEEYYEDSIKKLTNLSFENFVFILKEFLVLEEEDSYIVWNADKQNKIFLTFFDSDINTFERITNETKNFSSLKKQETYFKGNIEKSKKDLQLKLEKLKEKIDTEFNPLKITNLEEKIKKSSNEIKNITDNLSKIEISVDEKENKIQEIIEKKETLTEDLLTLENEYFGNTYNKYLHYYNKLLSYNICSFCNNKISDKELSLINNFKKNCQCPMCKKDIHLKSNNQNKDLLNCIEEKRTNLDKIERMEQQIEEEIKREKKELNKIKLTIEDLINKFNELKNNLFKEKLKQTEYEKFNTNNPYSLDNDIIKIQTDFLIIDEQIEEKDQKIKEYGDKIREKNIELNDYMKKIYSNYIMEVDKFIEKLNENIKIYFYAHNESITFEKIEAESVLLDDFNINIENKKNVFYQVMPRLNNNLRNNPKNLGTSERLIIEYIFRFTLLEYLESTSNIETFFILETSEGSFDYLKVNDLASTINKLSNKLNSSVITVTNIHDPYFLSQYVTKENTFNFFKLMEDSDEKDNLLKLVNKIMCGNKND